MPLSPFLLLNSIGGSTVISIPQPKIGLIIVSYSYKQEVLRRSHYERQSVGQSVLVSGPHPRPATNFSFCFEQNFALTSPTSRSRSVGIVCSRAQPMEFSFDIFFRQLRVCYFVAPSLTRGRICNLLLLLVLSSAVTLGLPSLTEVRSVLCHPFVSISP
jgi:hypothetical protein